MQQHNSSKWAILYGILILSARILAIGITIPAVSSANPKLLTSSENLLNCVGYRTSRDDIIFVSLKTGDRQPSQKLNLKVLDSDNNVLRAANDISDEISFLFTNLNNPIQIKEDTSFNFLDRFSPRRERDSKETPVDEKYGDLLDPYSGSSFIYICFDNLYYDRSWSFKPQTRDIDLRVQIKNATTLSQTNYNEFAKYFRRITLAEDRGAESSQDVRLDFTQKDFEEATNMLTVQLEKIREQLRSSEDILNTLKDHESRLRDVNEAIFAKYTTTSVAILASICVFGLLQVTYFKFYLKRKRII
ncbi:hypothetical protein CXQ85_003949 [Candidozyma haemuli]|uniref:GOLD domain-containing protein n=1 Tax=Candidozyma haemuli TaxID=45357 RepID=A0A2V1B0I4_9ASCO|nr:hypothetical protein CXQ85_003949 [[Candida] haemuloni]PVH23658.1 hypothetical protein CXQ85_003949 [[Candida] haemuloni]